MCQILLIEDDDGIGQMVRDVLSDEGYAVELAAEGQAGLSYLHGCRHLPQLILLDLVMPGMDGVQFLELQQNDPRLAEVPVLLFSAASALEQVALRFRAAYFPKPFDVTILLTMVEHYVPARQPELLMPA